MKLRSGFFIVAMSLLLGCATSGKVKEVNAVEAAKSAGTESQVVVTPNSSSESSASQVQAYAATNGMANAVIVKSHLDFLASDALAGRETGTAGIRQAADYAIGIFKKAGTTPFYLNYQDDFDAKGAEAFNIVAKVTGTDPQLKEQYIIVGAHYDHIGSGEDVNGDTIANGANDNASGSTAVLELAKYFAANPPKRSLLFTLFSAEEKGLLGSKHLAERLANENINVYTMFNIEMVGVPMTGKDYLLYLTGYEESNMAEMFNSYCDGKIIGFLPQAKEYNLFKRSDNYPFYERLNIPAQTVSSFDFTNFEYYHHVDDEVQYMDIGHLTNVINSLIPGIRGMANDPQTPIKLYE
ncbi:MAG: M20/M25/M40 family metallo-hydrolase [Leeuwenhoekiella sp.]